ncbi:accessory factor UbiK family protein [Roseomonas sp. OT10]|uniref:accessory factor UbiK family protein n=1 Tax=Roseomonas cutis TaxID=2897332 RepID=UPI001E6064EF|nr:accessory factor UbiK family protein [Roseomonas sp. OT10]UFN50884.1 accessory factor UbiK family protein [Roseomonas sp. OT10]
MQQDSGTKGGEGGTGAGRGFGGGRGGRIFDDLAGVAGGAFSALTGLRQEIESAVRSQTEAVIQRLELVKREELDAAMELARRAREQSEHLAARVEALEARLRGMPAAPEWSTSAGEPGMSGDPGGNPVPGSAPGASVADAATPGGTGPDSGTGESGGSSGSQG